MVRDINNLLLAAQEGDCGQVTSILSKGDLEANSQDENSTTALQVAAANDHADLLLLLLEKFQASVNLANNVGWTPLHQACWYGHNESIAILIAHGADLSNRTKYGATPLCIAAAAGHLSTVRLLLENGGKVEEPAPPQPQYKTCPTACITAAMYGRDNVVRSLLNRGAKVDSLAAPGRWTPLMFAAAIGSTASCHSLLERGADPNKVNLLGATALEIAIAAGNNPVRVFLESRTAAVPKFLDSETKDMDLLDAAKYGNLERVEELLGLEDTNVDNQDPDGATPLILAAVGGFLEIAKLLISLGANLDHQDRVYGWTALMQATFYSHQSIVQALIDAKADPTVEAFNGCTALDLATLVDDKDSQMVRILAQQTIKVKPPNLVLSSERVRRRLPKTPRPSDNSGPITPKLAFATKSFSLDEVTGAGGENGGGGGIRNWWNKFSNRFKKLSPVLANEEQQDEELLKNIQAGQHEGNGLPYQSFLPQSSVFTLGFAPTSTINLEPATVMSTCPSFRHNTHNTSLSPGKLYMPPGKDTIAKTHVKVPKIRTITLETDISSPSSSLGTTAGEQDNLRRRTRVPNSRINPTNQPGEDGHRQGRGREKRGRRRKQSDHGSSDSKSSLTVQGILKSLDLLHYYPSFIEHEIDIAVMIDLSDNDLQELGVESRQERKKLLTFVKGIKA